MSRGSGYPAHRPSGLAAREYVLDMALPMLDRRRAVAALFGLLGGPAVARRLAAAESARPLGIQLYTLRGLMARDVEGTLAAVAEIGYREVEFAGYFGRTAAQIRAAVSRAGLQAPAAHVGYDQLGARWPHAVDDALRAGHRYLVIAWIPANWRQRLDDWRRFAEQMNEAGAAAARAGLTLAYHNHDFEFAPLEGRIPFEIFLESLDPASVALELDLYWASKAGGQPASLLTSGIGRYRMVHVKDMDGTAERRMVDPGAGTLDFSALLGAASRAGVEHWFVEHDNPPDPLATARAGHAYLAKLAG